MYPQFLHDPVNPVPAVYSMVEMVVPGCHWIVNIFLDNFFKVVLPVLYRSLISRRGMYSVIVIPVYIIP